MRDKKKIVIGVLCALVGIMAVGYAALASQLNITGTASIDSTWKVEITNITEGNIVGDATSKETPSYTATTANFSVGLIQPGDSITYDIEISNLGTLAAKVDSINVVMDENDAITYTTEGLAEGDTLGVNEKDTLSVTVGYNSEVTSQPSVTAKDITITINYVQDLGGEGDTITTHNTYSIGDQITFAGSNWYVIKNSTADENYVTLLKENNLTVTELGEYAYDTTCTTHEVTSGLHGCTEENQAIKSNNMAYYWSDTCHTNGTYGYTDTVIDGCSGHNNYEESKVKEFLEGSYINTLGDNNLKEVDGYKIRLITFDEIMGDLGAQYENQVSFDITSLENVPSWISSTSYWTMSPYANDPSTTYSLNYGRMLNSHIATTATGVRPVINLLKSSI